LGKYFVIQNLPLLLSQTKKHYIMKLPFHTIYAFLIFVGSACFLHAQSYVPSLRNDVILSEFNEANQAPESACFDPDDVFDQCQKVWVRVNIHFFLDDNCEGDLAMGPCDDCNLASDNAAALAEDLIYRANAFADNMSDNHPFPNELAYTGPSEPYTPPCFPIRFLLKGVHIHCKSDLQQISGGNLNHLWVNPDSEINIMLTDIANSPFGNPTGYATYYGNYMVSEAIDWAGPSVLLHEMCHIAGVRHPWDESGNTNLPDTWNPVWEWDHDCNPSTFPIVDEACWSDEPTFNGESACDGNFCIDHPCCGWSMQTTNIMAYSGWAANAQYATISPGQVRWMLKNLSTLLCHKIEYVGGDCPPPSAIVTSIPESSKDDCKICFDFRASMNESAYSLTLNNALDPFGVPVQATGWIQETAGIHCIHLKTMKNGSNSMLGGLIRGNSYTARLMVRNDCGIEDGVTVSFAIPASTNCLEQVVSVEVTPNPATLDATILLKPWRQAHPKVLYSHIVYGAYEKQEFQTEMHENEMKIRFNTSSWLPGLHVAHVFSDGEVHSVTIIKE